MSRRGRKPKTNTKREPNGKPSRRVAEVAKRFYADLDRAESEIISTGIAARERLFGLGEADSRDQMGGSFIGRLCLGGDISREQYDAAMTWQAEAEAYSAARSSPKPFPSAIDLNRVQGRPVAAEHGMRDIAAVLHYEESRQVVQDAQNALRGRGALFAALSYVVERDVELHHLIGDCRLALNALAKHYERVAKRMARLTTGSKSVHMSELSA